MPFKLVRLAPSSRQNTISLSKPWQPTHIHNRERLLRQTRYIGPQNKLTGLQPHVYIHAEMASNTVEKHQGEIFHLYIVQNRKLADVLDLLKQKHNLKVS